MKNSLDNSELFLSLTEIKAQNVTILQILKDKFLNESEIIYSDAYNADLINHFLQEMENRSTDTATPN